MIHSARCTFSHNKLASLYGLFIADIHGKIKNKERLLPASVMLAFRTYISNLWLSPGSDSECEKEYAYVRM